MNYPLISKLLGMILFLFSLSMLTMLPVALAFAEWLSLLRILESILISIGFSAVLYLIGRQSKGELYRRDALAVVGLSWMFVAALGAFPFWLGGMVEGYTDGFFEAMSGLTTTGASILRDVEEAPKCFLFWRSFLHFLGGIGIIVFFVAILPVLGVGGKNLFKQEVPGPVPEGLTPRIKDTAITLCKIYIAFNIIEFFLLMFAGLGFFDALNHAMATMATGGFSTKSASVGAFSAAAEWIIIIFMFIAGTNFSLHNRFIKGDFLCYFRDAEFRLYLSIIAAAALLFTFVLWITANPSVSHQGGVNVRDSIFTSLTIITTTGFGTVDFDQWPVVCRIMIVLLMFVGGMAGSTAGGMKIIRWLILTRSALFHIGHQATPRAVRVLKIDGKVLDKSMQAQVFAFFFIYISVFVVVSLSVSLLSPSMSIVTTISAVAACLNNIGPGLEAVGPTLNYADFHPAAKWILSISMVMGRIELYAVLALMTPRFWFPRY